MKPLNPLEQLFRDMQAFALAHPLYHQPNMTLARQYGCNVGEHAVEMSLMLTLEGNYALLEGVQPHNRGFNGRLRWHATIGFFDRPVKQVLVTRGWSATQCKLAEETVQSLVGRRGDASLQRFVLGPACLHLYRLATIQEEGRATRVQAA